MTRQGKVEAIYTLPVFLLSQAIFENKNKFVYGGVVHADNVKYSISKNKVLSLLFERVNWSPFRH